MNTTSMIAAVFGITLVSMPAQAAAPAPAQFGVRTAEALFEKQDFEVIRVQESRTGDDAPATSFQRSRPDRYDRFGNKRPLKDRRADRFKERRSLFGGKKIKRFNRAVILKQSLDN